jgi:hypothetical protein
LTRAESIAVEVKRPALKVILKNAKTRDSVELLNYPALPTNSIVESLSELEKFQTHATKATTQNNHQTKSTLMVI